jgi:hypothetical protein
LDGIINAMSESAFVQAAKDLANAVNDAFNRPAKLPAFILVYASIDIMASLTRPITTDDTSSDLFKKWVDEYMLPNSGLTCTADDLWAARCGFLHTYTIQSKASRQGRARELHYTTAERDCIRFIQTELDQRGESKVIVHLEDLVNGFIAAVARFGVAVQREAELRSRVFHHAQKLIVHRKVEVQSAT